MPLLECLRLRVKDIDLTRNVITIREGKGDRDRRTRLPEVMRATLQAHLEVVKLLHGRDLVEGFGAVHLPAALNRKYPGAPRAWQYVFPAHCGVRIHERASSGGIT